MKSLLRRSRSNTAVNRALTAAAMTTTALILPAPAARAAGVSVASRAWPSRASNRRRFEQGAGFIGKVKALSAPNQRFGAVIAHGIQGIG